MLGFNFYFKAMGVSIRILKLYDSFKILIFPHR
jgi:hypothetical protein